MVMISLEKTIVLPQGNDTFVSLMLVCFCASAFADTDFINVTESSDTVLLLFFLQGAQILSAAKELGQLSKLKVSQSSRHFSPR